MNRGEFAIASYRDVTNFHDDSIHYYKKICFAKELNPHELDIANKKLTIVCVMRSKHGDVLFFTILFRFFFVVISNRIQQFDVTKLIAFQFDIVSFIIEKKIYKNKRGVQ